MTDMHISDEILIYPARWRVLVNVVLYGAFVFTGFALIATPDQISRLVGSAAVVFFGLLLTYAVLRLLLRAPSLVINEQGITDNASLTSVGLIAWDEITGIARKKNYLVHHIAITVRDRDTVVMRVPLPRRWLVEMMDIIAQGNINITPGFLGSQLDEVERLLIQRREHFEKP
ncbi:MAG: hypothetical protein OSB67_06180 [Alphaproteobacteria bacterium]|jgi:hypothetical protein|nr:hypothetical protein [Alphaproteobacteria bacterium]